MSVDESHCVSVNDWGALAATRFGMYFVGPNFKSSLRCSSGNSLDPGLFIHELLLTLGLGLGYATLNVAPAGAGEKRVGGQILLAFKVVSPRLMMSETEDDIVVVVNGDRLGFHDEDAGVLAFLFWEGDNGI